MVLEEFQKDYKCFLAYIYIYVRECVCICACMCVLFYLRVEVTDYLLREFQLSNC